MLHGIRSYTRGVYCNTGTLANSSGVSMIALVVEDAAPATSTRLKS